MGKVFNYESLASILGTTFQSKHVFICVGKGLKIRRVEFRPAVLRV